MNTKYGQISEELLQEYKDKLTGKVFKILPMKEENCSTWELYIESLLHELFGCKEIVNEWRESADFLSLVSILEEISNEDDISIIKREVFNCLNLIKKM